MSTVGASTGTDARAQPARVLSVHCYYREPGGEDTVFEAEASLLAAHGHAVETFVRRNADLPVGTAGQKVAAAAQTIWARQASRELAGAIDGFRPDVVHVHNTFQRLSPAVYRTCKRMGVPVVQTLHNYRYGCVAATLFRDGHPCEDCVGRPVPWPGVAHACYRDSRIESAVTAAMTTVHRSAGSWAMVDRYIAPTAFAKSRFVDMGLPAGRLTVKPHVIPVDPGPRPPGASGDHLLYAGRLTADKGLQVLLDAAARCPDVPVVIAGDGPLRAQVQDRTVTLPHVRLVGQQSRADLATLMAAARAVVVPSQLYETFGMVAAEAHAHAVPVIATAGGALADVVVDGETGWLFPRGDAGALAGLLRRAWDAPDQLVQMGLAGRRRFETLWSPAAGYRALTAVYAEVMDRG